MKSPIATVKRPDGKIEIVDISKMTRGFDAERGKIILSNIRKATKAAGRGEVLSISCTIEKSNASELAKLQKQYNDLYNEGGEGYLPELSYFGELKTWEENIEVK